MRAALILIIVITPNFAGASSRPDWVDHYASEDADNRYYVGRATSAPSDEDAVFQATTHTRKQAIGENFGVYVNFESRSHRSFEALSSSQSAQELSGQVRLEGFTQKDIYFERNDSSVNAWILYQYPKAEITKEKERLSKLRANTSNEDAFKMNDYGSVPGDRLGVLEVHSHPEGLKVRIDTHDEIIGKALVTPLKIGLEVGHHIVMIDDPKYRVHREAVNILPGNTAMVDAVMERAYGSIIVVTDPDQASVSIGATTLKSPTKKIKVPAGIPILIQINHPEAKETKREEVTVGREEEVTKNYSLSLRPALVSVSSIPDGATIEIDGIRVGTTPSTVEVSARNNHTLNLTKLGYQPLENTLATLPGGGTTILEQYRLRPHRKLASVESINTSISDTKIDHSSPLASRSFWLGLRTGYAGSTVSGQSNGSGSAGIFTDYQIASNIGIEAGVDFGTRTDHYANGDLKTHKWNFQAGLPITLFWLNNNKSRFFVEPGYFYLLNQYSFGQSGASNSSASQNQSGWLALGGMDFYTGMAGSAPSFLRITAGTGSPSGGSGITSSRFFVGSLGFSFGFGGKE